MNIADDPVIQEVFRKVDAQWLDSLTEQAAIHGLDAADVRQAAILQQRQEAYREALEAQADAAVCEPEINLLGSGS